MSQNFCLWSSKLWTITWGNKDVCWKCVPLFSACKTTLLLFCFNALSYSELKIKSLFPCHGSNHKFMLSFHFSTVEAIYTVQHDCTPFSAHSKVSPTTWTLLHSHAPSGIEIRRCFKPNSEYQEDQFEITTASSFWPHCWTDFVALC